MPSGDPSAHGLLTQALAISGAWFDSLPDRHVGPVADAGSVHSSLDVGLTDHGVAPDVVLAELASAVDPGLAATPGPRYFGFVIGGALPVAVAADWLTSAWDQNGVLSTLSPAAAAVEDVCSDWVLELLDLPETASVGFVTGAQMANFTALAAARNAVLGARGWDVEADGLVGAPAIEVFAGEQMHATIPVAVRLLGLGADRIHRVPADDQGRMIAGELAAALAQSSGPAIVCAQAGEVNSGAFDPLEEIADAVEERGAWLHVDGAFGLWAAASPGLRHLVRGAERADSWATDAHKWLNVPYDSGLAIVADPDAHRAAVGLTAAYLPPSALGRDPAAFVPEASRRARGFCVYAALRSLGRSGVAELVDRCCALARQMAGELDAEPGLRILNDVVLNQVLVGLDVPSERQAAATADTIAAVQDDGTCWLGGTTWRGTPAIRVSISNWSTTEDDISRSARAIAAAASAAAG